MEFYGFCKHSHGEATIVEQLAIVTSTFTWLTLVPPAFFNGFLGGWPLVFIFVYHHFFFFNASIRQRLYGDYYMRPHDPKWDVNVPGWYRVLFGVGVMVGHWLAAFEGPELHLFPGGWTIAGIWGLIMTALFMHHHASLYLANYSREGCCADFSGTIWAIQMGSSAHLCIHDAVVLRTLCLTWGSIELPVHYWCLYSVL